MRIRKIGLFMEALPPSLRQRNASLWKPDVQYRFAILGEGYIGIRIKRADHTHVEIIISEKNNFFLLDLFSIVFLKSLYSGSENVIYKTINEAKEIVSCIVIFSRAANSLWIMLR